MSARKQETVNSNPTIRLGDIRSFLPCATGWRKALVAYDNNMHAIISLGDIAHSNGAIDAFWALRCFEMTESMKQKLRAKVIQPAFVRTGLAINPPSNAAAYATAYAAAYAYAAAAAYAAAYAAERKLQRQAIITAFPPVYFASPSASSTQ